METLVASAQADLTVKKSRFLACVEPCPDRPAALVRVAVLRQQHPQAAHVCWALLAGGHSAAHDDGEPGGTAGRPMLEVLRHQQLDAVLATVVRYFGGVKLGAGGLVRAYGDAVAQALKAAVRMPLVALVPMRGTVPLALEGLLRRELAAAGVAVDGAEHGAMAQLSWQIAADQAEPLRSRLTNLTSGRIAWATHS